MEEIWNEIRQIFNETSTYLVGTGVGLLAKISYDIYMKRTLSLLQWVAVIAISVFSGYLCSVWCMSGGHTELSQVLVPLATLFGEKVVQYLMENHKTILNNLVNLLKKK